MSWEVDKIIKDSDKGSSTTTDSTDDVTTTTNRGVRTTTKTTPKKTTSQDHGERTTTEEFSDDSVKEGTTTVKTIEDAGGMVSFKISVHGGIGLLTPLPICTP